MVVVDDEPDVAVYLAAVLEKKGHTAHTAKNAAEGFAMIKSLHPDVACIDIVMPEETGVALFRKIRADDEVGDTPVVFITALKPEMAAYQNGMNVEPIPKADEYVEKPPDSAAFVEAVERAARSRRSRK
ncbi:MAG: response regulator [Acidobacteria bacterium]|nr:response regulator [Acidobacteriota bacterium]